MTTNFSCMNRLWMAYTGLCGGKWIEFTNDVSARLLARHGGTMMIDYDETHFFNTRSKRGVEIQHIR